MRGLGTFQLKQMKKREERLLAFIRKIQPVRFSTIRNKGHFRTNTLRQYLNDLIERKKIFKIKHKEKIYYLIYPPHFSMVEKLGYHPEFKGALKEIVKIWKQIFYDITKFSKKQPVLFKIICKKIRMTKKKFYSLIEYLLQLVEHFFLISKFLKSEDKKLQQIGLKKLENLDKKILTASEAFFDFWEELEKYRRIYPRIEYPRLKDRYTNPHGIHVHYRNKKGQLEISRVEEEYKKNLKII